MRVQLQPAFILHSRPYRDSSVIVDVITRDYGRLSILAKGQRVPSAKKRKPLQPFQELSLSWQGERDLKLLTNSEIRKPTPSLIGTYLYSGIYVNELLSRLVVGGDVCTEIFQLYRDLLFDLGQQENIEISLRCFELQLLDQLGYGVDFFNDCDTNAVIETERVYAYEVERGFRLVESDNSKNMKSNFFNGDDLIAIGENNFSTESAKKSAKRFIRLALAPHLGNKALQSRELFMKHKYQQI